MTTVNYQRIALLYKGFTNPILRFLVLRFGVGSRGEQDVMRILRVQGRKSGRLYDVPVRLALLDGQHYILSMLGESQWVRNLRTNGIAELIVGKTIEPIRAYELYGEEKASFFQWYCKHPKYEMRARTVLSADTMHLTAAEVDRLAHLYPVFRLELI
ncbi:MAG: nitroreductase/quinone reductase family protein [Chloroflexota bacterium]